MSITKNLHWILCFMLALGSCARQSSPTGGPKDTIPPTLIRAFPPDETINFDASEIQMIFSEDVILNSPKEQLIVTPTIGKDYEITYRKNTVTIKLEEPLLDSTTYTFNFRETVQDITEKNPVTNLQLAYSTGTYIDSLYIEGTIMDLVKGKVIKDATVALHTENDTFNIFEHPAVYFTKTDESGKFKISHLKPDNYFLYAFEDKNRNLIVNSRSEAYGFHSEYQYLLDNVENLTVGIIKLDAGPLKITSARPYNTYFNIRTSKNLRTFTLTATDSSDLTYSFGEDNANIRLYKTTELDSIQVHLLAIDSIDNAIDTTLYAKFLTREVTPEDFNVSITEASILASTGKLDAILQFTKPLKEINFDSLFFKVDSLTTVPLQPADLTWSKLKKTITISKTLDKSYFDDGQAGEQTSRGMRRQAPTPEQTDKPKTTTLNELHLRQGAFISIENDTSSTTVQNITPRKQEDLSIINIEIETAEEFYLVELIDSKQNVIRQVKNTPKVRFENVVPGEYQIRLIIDRNQNGRWDPGNYFKNTEPEPIIYYRSTDGTTNIKGVKANWDIGSGEMFITY